MICIICKTGNCHPGITHHSKMLGYKLVVIKNIPADICENCGEAYFYEETVVYIEKKTKEAIEN